jgi:hypothetical protein
MLQSSGIGQKQPPAGGWYAEASMADRHKFGCQVVVREIPPLRRVRAAGRVAPMNAAFHTNLMPPGSGRPAEFPMADKALP